MQLNVYSPGWIQACISQIYFKYEACLASDSSDQTQVMQLSPNVGSWFESKLLRKLICNAAIFKSLPKIRRLIEAQQQGQMHLLHHYKHQQLHICHVSVVGPSRTQYPWVRKSKQQAPWDEQKVPDSCYSRTCSEEIGRQAYNTPKSVTIIRAPLHPRGCPKETAPPCTLILSCKRCIKRSETIIIIMMMVIKAMVWCSHFSKSQFVCHYLKKIAHRSERLTTLSPSSFMFATATTCSHKQK